MQLWAIVVDSFRESLDRKIFWVIVAITLFVAAAMLSVSFEPDRVSFLFGLWEPQTNHFNPVSALGRSRIVGLVVYMLMSVFLGWIGVILMIIATASVFPSMTERGAIDVLMAKPISRSRLFLYKYLAGMVFVLFQATLFVGLTFLVMGIRWRVWVPGYLLSIPLLVLLFSYVYCVSVLVGVRTRSTVAAILLSLGAWVLFATPPNLLEAFETMTNLRQEQSRVYRTVQTIGWILPKTADIPYLAAQWAQAGTSIDVFPPNLTNPGGEMDQEQWESVRQMERRLLTTNPVLSIGSSLLFQTVVVLGAMWTFARKDY